MLFASVSYCSQHRLSHVHVDLCQNGSKMTQCITLGAMLFCFTCWLHRSFCPISISDSEMNRPSCVPWSTVECCWSTGISLKHPGQVEVDKGLCRSPEMLILSTLSVLSVFCSVRLLPGNPGAQWIRSSGMSASRLSSSPDGGRRARPKGWMRGVETGRCPTNHNRGIGFGVW